MRVFVTDGDYKNALAAVRALAAEGAEVHVGESSGHALCFYSKYVSKRFTYPSPLLRESFIHALEGIDSREDYDAILPIGYESYFSLVTKSPHYLCKKTLLPSKESYSITCNKLKTMVFAKEHGIPIPSTMTPHDKLGLAELRFPVIVKRVLGQGSTRIVSNVSQLHACLEANQSKRNPFIVQEFVNGQGYGFFGLYERGKLRAYFMHKRVREVPPSGGASSAAQSIYDPDLFAVGNRIMKLLSWNGVAMVEFRRDAVTQEYKLLEINPKFWGSLDLAIASGVNFPYLVACIISSSKYDCRPGNYAKGMRYCWPIPDDLLHLHDKPSDCLTVLRDWTDTRVGKNLWVKDLSPQACRTAWFCGQQVVSHFQQVRDALRRKPKRFTWIIPDKLAASAMPRSRQLNWLRRHGVRAILDLTESSVPSRLLNDFVYLNVEMHDHEPPSIPQLREAVDFLTYQVSADRAVLVHCFGGLGRTGTVLACFLIVRNRMRPEAAIIDTRSKRPGSIEPCQEASILTFSNYLAHQS